MSSFEAVLRSLMIYVFDAFISDKMSIFKLRSTPYLPGDLITGLSSIVYAIASL